MSCVVKINEPLEAGDFTSGKNSDGGKWEMIVVKDTGKGKRDICIFPTNVPSGVTKGGLFKLSSIEAVKWGARQDREGKWREKVTVNATVQSAASAQKPDRYISNEDSATAYSGLMQEITVDDDELPW